MMYEVNDGNITFTLSRIELSVLLYGIDTSPSNDPEFIAIREMLCGIWNRLP